MAVDCRTCRHYQTSIIAKKVLLPGQNTLPCYLCADLPERDSFYVPIHTRKKYERGGRWDPTRPGT